MRSGVDKHRAQRSVDSPVSQICALTVFPSTWMDRVANSTPMVDLLSRLNSFRVKRESTARTRYVNLGEMWELNEQKRTVTVGKRRRGGVRPKSVFARLTVQDGAGAAPLSNARVSDQDDLYVTFSVSEIGSERERGEPGAVRCGSVDTVMRNRGCRRVRCSRRGRMLARTLKR